MIGKTEENPQLNVFRIPLVNVINMKHELVELAQRINWKSIEKDFAPYYADMGRPAVPVRKMVGCMLLKQMYGQSDESFVDRWIENPYWQYFCGETYFQFEKPFDPSEFVHLCKRLGTDGAEKLLKLSISLFEKKEVEEKEVLIDTTVQEKNITYPTDAKLHKKIIEGCWKIAEKEAIDLRQSYSRTLGQLMIDQRFREHPKRKRKAMAAARKIKTIAGRLVRDVERGLDDKERLEAYDEQLWLYYRVLGQKRDSHNKIYSFHAPEVSCISKGKDHKKYEFGNKSGFVITKNSGIILGAMAFEGNPYDGHTLQPQLEQVSDLMGRLPKVALVDRGYKGRKTILGVEIMMPGTGKGKTAYEKIRDRARFRRRAAVEPVIGHLKSDYRMLRNYLKGVEGDMINTIMAAVAFNMMKRLRQIRDAIYFVLDLLTGNWSVKYATVQNY
jgi:IS5 family transposase